MRRWKVYRYFIFFLEFQLHWFEHFVIYVSILYVSDWCLLSWMKHFSLIITQFLKPIEIRDTVFKCQVCKWCVRAKDSRAVSGLSRHSGGCSRQRLWNTTDRSILKQLSSLPVLLFPDKQKPQEWSIPFGKTFCWKFLCSEVRRGSSRANSLRFVCSLGSCICILLFVKNHNSQGSRNPEQGRERRDAPSAWGNSGETQLLALSETQN